MWHVLLCYQLFIGFLQVKYFLLSDYQRHEGPKQTDFCVIVSVCSFAPKGNKQIEGGGGEKFCTEIFILFLLNLALSVLCFFAVFAGTGVWDIFCFVEHFLNRLEKTRCLVLAICPLLKTHFLLQLMEKGHTSLRLSSVCPSSGSAVTKRKRNEP